MKKIVEWFFDFLISRRRTLMIMKNLMLFLIVINLQVSANVLGQKVTLQLNDVSLKECLKAIEEQTDLGFLYNGRELSQVGGITINVEEADVKDVLEELLANEGYAFDIKNDVILIRKADVIRSIQQEPQEKKIVIKGTVTDEKGEPLPFAAVCFKGTTSGCVSAVDGTYELEAPDEEGLVLEISSLGFVTQEIPVDGRTTINIILLPDLMGLEEVIVVGYGASKRERIGSAISEIKSEALEEQAMGVTSFENILGGNIKGLQVSQGSGAPGAAATIRIRGITSPFSGGNNQPLYVVDGVEFNTDQQGGGVSTYTLNPLESINPNDIKSISVLKDAGATAIYGSRGANGVIIITTKRGSRDSKLSVTFDASMSFSNPIETFDLLNASEFKQLHQMIAVNTHNKTGGTNAEAALIYNGTDFNDSYTDAVTGETLPMWGNVDTDWQNEAYKKNAPIQKYSLTLAGGNQKTNYSLSMNYSDMDGLITNDNQRRYGSRLTLDSDVNQWLKIGSTLNVNATNNRKGLSTPQRMLGARPDYAITNTDGLYVKQPGVDEMSVNQDGHLNYTQLEANPVASTLDENITKSTSIFGNGYLEIKPFKDLKLRSELNVANFISDNNHFTPYDAIDYNLNDPREVTNRKTLAFSNTLNTTLIFQGNYLKVINDHSIDVMAGISSNKNRYESRFSQFYNTPDSKIITNVDLATFESANESKSESVMNSWYSRIQYAYKGKYAITANMRSDKSSKFGPGNKTGYFPSGAISWNATQEEFLKNLTALNLLKLRASYGKTGLANISDFTYLRYFSAPEWSNKTYLDNTIVYPEDTYPNVNIGWETTKEFNVGIDFGLLNSRLYGSIDYYDKYTDGAIMATPIFPESGAATMFDNRAEISNSGMEFEIGGDIIRNSDFIWSANFNIAFNRNTLESIKDNAISEWVVDRYIEGETIGTITGLRVSHIIKDQSEIDALNAKAQEAGFAYYQDATTGVGDYLYKDLDGSGHINAEDKDILGSQEADFFGGFSTSLRYKNLSFTAAFQYSVGNEKRWDNIQYMQLYPRLFANMGKEALYNTYSEENKNAEYPMLTYGNFNNSNFQGSITDKKVQDASYLRLKVININYQLPKRFTDKLRVDAMSVYFGGTNLLTFTNYEGLDPESTGGFGGNTGNVLSGAYGGDFYPMTRTYTMGVKVSF